jgi:hypothetical protein
VFRGIVQFALLAAALADIYRRPAREINGSKWLWSAAALHLHGHRSYRLLPLRAEARVATEHRHGRRNKVKEPSTRLSRWVGRTVSSRGKETG